MLPRGLLKTHADALVWAANAFDLVLFVLSGLLALYVRFGYLRMDYQYFTALLLSALLIVPVFSFSGIYGALRGRSLFKHLCALYFAITVLMLLLAAISFITKTGDTFSRAWFIIWMFLAAVDLTMFRLILRYLLAVMRKYGWNQRQVVIVGDKLLTENLISRVKTMLWSGFNVIDVINVRKLPEDFTEKIAALHPDEVWLALPLMAEESVRNIMQHLRHSVVTIRYFPDLFGLRLINSSTSEILGLVAFDLVSTPMTGINRVIKALEDRILAAIILLIISPLLLIIAILVKLSSPGPVFFRQKRMSWNGKEFDMLKFRSMPMGAEKQTGAVWANKEDNRATKIGAFLRRVSLDELPQFINVLKGDMSIVGPRPERPVFVEQFKNEIPNYMQKHLVKAGITGWAQVNGWRGSTSLEKRIEYDMYYIENWSFWFDMKIIALTFVKGFVSENAY